MSGWLGDIPLIDQLERNSAALQALFRGVGDEQARWRPAPEKWSILEVVNHLYDEERDDFRRRIDLTLHEPETPWPGINPQGWVSERRYNERDLGESLRGLAAEREQSVAWLRALKSPDWTLARTHPVAGRLSAGDLLASWVAHDFLHMRQVAGLHLAHAALLSKPYSQRYAGA